MAWKCRYPYSPKIMDESSWTKHGMSRTPFYRCWVAFRKRCNNPNDDAYKNYGGRGVKVCERWNKSFEHFKNDMYESYEEHAKLHGHRNTTLDRIDVNGDYSPDNCRWATRQVQATNRRTNYFEIVDDKKLTTKEVAELAGVSVSAISLRRKKKSDVMQKKFVRTVTIDGIEMTLVEASEKYGINYHTLLLRILRHGFTDNKLLENGRKKPNYRRF